MKRVALLVAVIVVLAVLAYGFLPCLLQPTPEQLLDKVAKAYATAEDYTMRCDMVQERDIGGMRMKQKGPGTLVFKRPNKLYVASGSEGDTGETVTICDGENLYEYVRAWKQCRKSDAPEKVSQIDRVQELRKWGETIDTYSLLDGVALKGKIKSATLEPVKPFRRESLHVLHVTCNDGSEETLWIRKHDLLIHKSEWRPSMGAGDGEPGEDAAAVEGTDGMVAQMLGNIKLTITQTARELSVNSGVEDEQFAWNTPEGVKVVDEFDVPFT